MQVKRIVIIGFVALLCVLSVGCGSSSSSSPISQTDASNFMANVAYAGVDALSASGAARGGSASALKNIQAHLQKLPAVQGAKPETVTYSCNATSCTFGGGDSFSVPCTSSGVMEAVSDVSGYTNASGGDLNFDVTLTANSCSDGGGPSINSNGIQVNTNYDTLDTVTPFTMSISGGFWSGSQSCTIDISANANANGQGDISGTACGYSINSTF